MNSTIPNFQKNEASNPLFAKMWERFCEDGTIAERMAVEAGISKRKKKKQAALPSASEYSMTHGNSLPRRKAEKAKNSLTRAIFSLKNFVVLSLGVLMIGILFLSGASFTGIRQSFAESVPAGSAASEQIFTENAEEPMLETLYFASEDLPEAI